MSNSPLTIQREHFMKKKKIILYLSERSRERAYLRYMEQQTCGPTCALALIRPHVFCRFGERFDIPTCRVQLSHHTELSQHHICTKGTPQARFVLVGADWVMELGSVSSY